MNHVINKVANKFIIMSICYVFFTFITSCIVMKSEKKYCCGSEEELINSYAEASKNKDKSCIKFVFINVYDARVSLQKAYYGMSVYQCKMLALQEISGLKAPVPITEKPDYKIIEYYYNIYKGESGVTYEDCVEQKNSYYDFLQGRGKLPMIDKRCCLPNK